MADWPMIDLYAGSEVPAGSSAIYDVNCEQGSQGTSVHLIWKRWMWKVGLKRIHRVPGYPVPQSTRIPDSKYSDSIVDQFCFETTSISTEPAQVYGSPESQSLKVLIRFENSSHHCFLSIKLLTDGVFLLQEQPDASRTTTRCQWGSSTWWGAQ